MSLGIDIDTDRLLLILCNAESAQYHSYYQSMSASGGMRSSRVCALSIRTSDAVGHAWVPFEMGDVPLCSTYFILISMCYNCILLRLSIVLSNIDSTTYKDIIVRARSRSHVQYRGTDTYTDMSRSRTTQSRRLIADARYDLIRG